MAFNLGNSINRNIVECKERWRFINGDYCDCINRNIVECKDSSFSFVWKLSSVLIETLWNVKDSGYHIDPWRRSINRNIVECKELRKEINLVMIFVLIETLWNVKYPVCPVLLSNGLVLIETLWNVKIWRWLNCRLSFQY